MNQTTRRHFLTMSGLGVMGLASELPLQSEVPASPGQEESETYELKRKIPVGDTYDLVILGGGPAGTGAAVCAARLGAKVLLVEAAGCLGGMGTSGLVTAFDPMANGKEMLVGGLMREIVETLYERKFLRPNIDPNT